MRIFKYQIFTNYFRAIRKMHRLVKDFNFIIFLRIYGIYTYKKRNDK